MFSAKLRPHLKSMIIASIGVGLLIWVAFAFNLTKGVIASHLQPSQPSASNSDPLFDAWIYPSESSSLDVLRQGMQLYSVKAEFLHVTEDGTLSQINQSQANPNGYSPGNMSIIDKHSRRQYITVSGTVNGTDLAMDKPETIPAMVELANKAGAGIELDWEGYGDWTPEYYGKFKKFVDDLHDALKTNGHDLMIVGPPIFDQESQGWYEWKYEELAPLADSIVMMVYDRQYDLGAGSSIAPHDWSLQCMKWLKDKAGHKAIAGVAAYGYYGQKGTWDINVATSQEIKTMTDGLAAERNSDGELVVENGQTVYVYADQQTMERRLEQVKQSGISRLSVWSLGGNPWFKTE